MPLPTIARSMHGTTCQGRGPPQTGRDCAERGGAAIRWRQSVRPYRRILRRLDLLHGAKRNNAVWRRSAYFSRNGGYPEKAFGPPDQMGGGHRLARSRIRHSFFGYRYVQGLQALARGDGEPAPLSSSPK